MEEQSLGRGDYEDDSPGIPDGDDYDNDEWRYYKEDRMQGVDCPECEEGTEHTQKEPEA
jgi:hypothetical protein